MLPEVPRSQEQEPRPRYDAALIHGYWLSVGAVNTRNEEARVVSRSFPPVGPSVRTHFAARAAALLYKRGEVGKIVLTGGKIWGDLYPSLGEVMKEGLLHYEVPESDIVLAEEATDTTGEINAFLNLADQNGWTSLADVAFAQHFDTISDLYPTLRDTRVRGKSVEFKSVEDILEGDDWRVKVLLDKFSDKYASNYQRSQSIQKLLIRLGLRRFLSRKPTKRGDIYPFQRFNPVDKYKLDVGPFPRTT